MVLHKSPHVLFIISLAAEASCKQKNVLRLISKILRLFKGVMKVFRGLFMSAIKHNVPLMEMIEGWWAGLLRTDILYSTIMMLPQPIILVVHMTELMPSLTLLTHNTQHILQYFLPKLALERFHCHRTFGLGRF